MATAFDFGKLIKRSFYVSPDMLASGNIGTVMPPKRKKKKKKSVDNNADEQPNRQAGIPGAKSAAYLFGAWMKQAQNPPIGGMTTSGSGDNRLSSPGSFPSLSAPPSQPANNSGLMTTGGSAPQPPKAPVPKWGQPPSFFDTYAHNFNRYYNPWSKAWNEPSTDAVDAALKWTGRGAMGVAAAAGTAAAGLAAAPALGFGGGAAAGGGTTAAGTTAGGVAAASQTPAGQNLLQRGSQMLGNVSSRLGDATFRAHDLGRQVFEKIPEPMKQFHESLEHTPVGSAISPTGVSNAMNPAFTTGDPRGLLPHSVTLPIEAAHHLAHNMGGHGEGGHGLTDTASVSH